jgi:hypothetical protein
MKRLAAVLLFVASMVGVIAFTHWLPTSPLSFVAGGGGPEGRENRKSRPDRPDRRDHHGPRNQNSPDLSIGALVEPLGTLVPQAVIVGAFAFSVEKSRRKRTVGRRAALGIEPIE